MNFHSKCLIIVIRHPWALFKRLTVGIFDIFVFPQNMGVQSPNLGIKWQKSLKFGFWTLTIWKKIKISKIPTAILLKSAQGCHMTIFRHFEWKFMGFYCFSQIWLWKWGIFLIYRDFPMFSVTPAFLNGHNFRNIEDNAVL